MTRRIALIAVVVLILPWAKLRAEDASPYKIDVTQEWHMVFGGQDIQLPIAIHSSKAIDARLGWSIAVGDRTMTRGERTLSLTDGKNMLTIPIKLPRSDKDVALAIRVVIQLLDNETQLAQTDTPLWIVSEDPFLDRHDWMKRTKIRLFDPVGETSSIFEDAHIPHERLLNVDAVSRIERGLLIIGEGTSLEEFSVLRSMIWEVAARGTAVLILVPIDGDIPLDAPNGVTAASQLHFRRADVLADLDKRFDWRAWPSGDPVVRCFRFMAARDEQVASVENGSHEWPWVRIDLPKPGRTIIACGFPVVTQWKSGPMPRHLLRRLLEVVGEDLDGNHEEGSSKETGT